MNKRENGYSRREMLGLSVGLSGLAMTGAVGSMFAQTPVVARRFVALQKARGVWAWFRIACPFASLGAEGHRVASVGFNDPLCRAAFCSQASRQTSAGGLKCSRATGR